jgi:hypothetical protein
MAIDKKKILFYVIGATALTLTIVGVSRVIKNKLKDDSSSVDLADSDYTLTYKKYKAKDSKNDGIAFEYSYKNQASAKKIENLVKQSFNIFDKFKVDVDSISNRPYFELTITDLKDPKNVIKKTILA